ncbi:hypothetical protein AB685_00350 [Bacillus sp. LL01]|uniref:phBC6A51 family helix-turn-helix protein n=1 Tax=Bacillus sp. LL01 TaxID=1665556 RepID=UPI00064D0C87|nr:phBC6A51 family helix-turn-helix protein [Bacillus sp. LL01]KMJ59378.1 hypothetical protein AB685_00350 [Bacillus sp. LL01]
MAKPKKKRSKQPSQVPQLDERHHLAIKLLVGLRDNRGRRIRMTRGQIADKCGISRMQLYRWEQRKDFQREKEKYREQLFRRIFPRRDSLALQALSGDVDAALTIFRAADMIV